MAGVVRPVGRRGRPVTEVAGQIVVILCAAARAPGARTVAARDPETPAVVNPDVLIGSVVRLDPPVHPSRRR